MRKYTIQEITQAIDVLDHMRESAINNPRYGFSDDWVTFMTKMRVLTSQSSSLRIQNYIFNVLGWTKLKVSENRGDVQNSIGQCYEVKVSVITPSNCTANIVQIRPWQNLAGYYIFVIDATKKYQVAFFNLSKSEMEEELILCAASAHGTKEANLLTTNREWAIHIRWNNNNEIYQRWITKYKQDTIVGQAAS